MTRPTGRWQSRMGRLARLNCDRRQRCEPRFGLMSRSFARCRRLGSGSWPSSRRRAAPRKRRSPRASRSPRSCNVIHPRAPEDRPRRRAAELRPELRAHVDLSQDDRIHREVERRHRRQGAEGRRARRPLRARAARALGTKKATVEYDKERVRLAQKDVEVADAEVKAARARLEEARAILAQVRGRGRALGRPGQAARA